MLEELRAAPRHAALTSIASAAHAQLAGALLAIAIALDFCILVFGFWLVWWCGAGAGGSPVSFSEAGFPESVEKSSCIIYISTFLTAATSRIVLKRPFPACGRQFEQGNRSSVQSELGEEGGTNLLRLVATCALAVENHLPFAAMRVEEGLNAMRKRLLVLGSSITSLYPVCCKLTTL